MKDKNKKKIKIVVMIIFLLLLLLIPISCHINKSQEKNSNNNYNKMETTPTEENDIEKNKTKEEIITTNDSVELKTTTDSINKEYTSKNLYTKTNNEAIDNIKNTTNTYNPTTSIDNSKEQFYVDISYSTDEITYNGVSVQITSQDELQPMDGWILSDDKKMLTKEYNKNIEEDLIVKNNKGYQRTVNIKISNIKSKGQEKKGTDNEFIYIVLDNGEIQITRYIGTNSDLIIPSTYDGYKVYSVGNPNGNKNNVQENYNIFEEKALINNTIKSLKIENGIKEISSGAFNGCTGLTGSLELPDSIVKIGNDAFANCSSLNGKLKLPNNLKELGSGAFYQDQKLIGDLIIPEGVEKINEATFFNCINLNGQLQLPSTLKSIGKTAFYKCSNLIGNLIIPDSVEYIGQWAFQHCTGFKGSLKLSSNLTTIDKYAFDDCTGLTGNLNLPDNLVSIGEWAFSKCKSLTGDLIIPDSVKYIGNYAFINCAGFKGKLKLSKELETINEGTFGLCTGLTGDLIIPEGIKVIGKYAFRGCVGFNGILKLPTTLKEIKGMSFDKCRNLTGDIIIPEGVQIIGDAAFQECYGFNGKLILPSTLENLGNHAFSHCQNINIDSLTIPKNLKLTGELDGTSHMFYNFATKTLKEFKVENGNKYYKAIDGILYNSDVTRLISYPSSKKQNTYTMPEGIKSINQMAFSRAGSNYSSVPSTGLKKIILPNSFIISTDIPKSYTVTYGNTLNTAIYVFTGIESIEVKDDNENYKTKDGILYSKDGTILWYVPVAKTGVITIEEGVTTIQKGALESSTTKSYDKTHRNLTKIIIPKTVTTIESREILELESLGKNKVIFESGSIYQFNSNGKIEKKQ